jgi:hypothetical protein
MATFIPKKIFGLLYRRSRSRIKIFTRFRSRIKMMRLCNTADGKAKIFFKPLV